VSFAEQDSVWVYKYFQKSKDPEDKRTKKLAYSGGRNRRGLIVHFYSFSDWPELSSGYSPEPP